MENKKETLFIVIIVLLVISTLAFAYAWYKADQKPESDQVDIEEERDDKETVEKEQEEEKEVEKAKDDPKPSPEPIPAPKPVKSYDAKGVKPKGTETLPFTVMVNSPDGELNVREAPNNNAKINTVVKNGEVFTVVEFSENKAWGKLKSGSGWIYLGLTKLFTVKK